MERLFARFSNFSTPNDNENNEDVEEDEDDLARGEEKEKDEDEDDEEDEDQEGKTEMKKNLSRYDATRGASDHANMFFNNDEDSDEEKNEKAETEADSGEDPNFHASSFWKSPFQYTLDDLISTF
jgi:hypothetical protein